MNKTIHLLGVQLIIASVMLISCNKDKNESSSSKGQITFSFANTLSKDNVKSSSDSAATANLTAAIVSIEDANGNLVQNGVTISLTNINGMYISTPIALVTGTYQLTEFLLVNQNNQVEYASPLKSSKLAYLVSNPLPNSFSIQSNAVTNLSPEVISTNGSNPADFGYGTFGFKVDSTFNFLIGAFIYNSAANNYQLITASISIYSDSILVYTGKLGSTTKDSVGIGSPSDSLGITNNIMLPAKYNTFRVVVSKQNYATYSQTFTKTQLRQYYLVSNKGPLVVVLSSNILSSGLVAWYPFNGDVKDYSGNNNNGTYYGRGVFTADHNSVANSAIDLNGSTDYISVPNSASLNPTNQLSISLWLEVDSFMNRYTAFIDKGGPTTTGFTNREYFDYINDQGVVWIDASGDNQPHLYVGAYFPGLKTWFHITATVDLLVTHQMQIYINGVLQGTIADSYSAFTINDYPLLIGAWAETNSEYAPYFKGKMDELRIYNRILSQAEITSLYNQ